CRETRLGEDLPPAFRRKFRRRQDRRDEEAEGRDEPERSEHDQDDVDRRPGDPAERLRSCAVLRLGDDDRFGGGGHVYCSLLKRRMLSARTGITSRNRITAIADPVPKSLTPPNDVRHIASAITLACDCDDSGASESTMSNTFSTLMIIVMKTTLRTG